MKIWVSSQHNSYRAPASFAFSHQARDEFPHDKWNGMRIIAESCEICASFFCCFLCVSCVLGHETVSTK